jgi:hypothetical protein
VDWISEHQSEYQKILSDLLSAPVHLFDDELAGRLPFAHGIYAISSSTDTPRQFLHVGKSKDGLNGLRGRVWVQPYQTGGSGGDPIEKVKLQLRREGEPGTPRQAKEWIKRDCQVQWVVVEDADIRKWSEHFVLSILRPIWGH